MKLLFIVPVAVLFLITDTRAVVYGGGAPLISDNDNARFELDNDNHWARLFAKSASKYNSDVAGDLLDIHNSFKTWAIKFQKEYMIRDVTHRFEHFKANHHHIDHHNSRPGISYTLGLNQFADMTNAEFRASG
eukprot:718355_1